MKKEIREAIEKFVNEGAPLKREEKIANIKTIGDALDVLTANGFKENEAGEYTKGNLVYSPETKWLDLLDDTVEDYKTILELDDAGIIGATVSVSERDNELLEALYHCKNTNHYYKTQILLKKIKNKS